MREEGSARVAELTGRNVVAMMSANHLNPDLGAEIFVLDGSPEIQVTTPEAPETEASSLAEGHLGPDFGSSGAVSGDAQT